MDAAVLHGLDAVGDLKDRQQLTSQADRTIATMIDHCAQELILLEHALHQLGRVVGYDIWAKARHLHGLHLGQRPDYRSLFGWLVMFREPGSPPKARAMKTRNLGPMCGGK